MKYTFNYLIFVTDYLQFYLFIKQLSKRLMRKQHKVTTGFEDLMCLLVWYSLERRNQRYVSGVKGYFKQYSKPVTILSRHSSSYPKPPSRHLRLSIRSRRTDPWASHIDSVAFQWTQFIMAAFQCRKYAVHLTSLLLKSSVLKRSHYFDNN